MSSKRPIGGKYVDSTTEEEGEMNDVSLRRSCRETANRKQYQEKIIEDEEIPEPRKRVRGPSKRPCLNRNALMARENRQRKKEYMQRIENKLLFYQQENKNLANIIQKQGTNIKRLTMEVTYLKNVLRNNTTITTLLRSINDSLKKKCTCSMNDAKIQEMDVVGFMSEGNEKNSKCKLETEDSFISYCYTIPEKNQNYRLPVAKKTANSFAENDHTYTTPKDFCLTNVENEFNNRESKSIKGINKMHDANNVYDINNTVSGKTVTDAMKLEDNKALMNNTNILKKTQQVDSIGAKIPLSIKKVKEKEIILENVDIKNTLNQENEINQNTTEANDFALISSTSSMISEPAEDCNSEQLGLDPLLPFNMDIFEDIPKCDEFANSIDDLKEDPDLFNDSNLLQNINNGGICLHVNSDKVSLEYCSVCHLNSVDFEIN